MENFQLYSDQFGPIQDCIQARKNEMTPLKDGQVILPPLIHQI